MEPYLGQIYLFAGNFVPRDFHACDGSLLSTQAYPTLFSLLETRYGGNGVNTFALPKMEPLQNLEQNGGIASQCKYIISLKGSFPPTH